MRQNRLLELERKQQQLKQEYEEMLTAFLLELEEENEKFLLSLTKKTQEQTKSEEKDDLNIEQQGNPTKEIQYEQKFDLNPLEFNRMQATIAYKNTQRKNIEENTDDHVENEEIHHGKEKEKNLSNIVSELLEKGLSVEEIAKQLQKGKTEIELLQRFYQNNK